MESRVRPWGRYTVVGKTKIIEVNPNSKLSLQLHKNRQEFWQIINGNCEVVIGNKKMKASPGDSFQIEKETTHRLITKNEPVTFLEIATGNIDEDDIIRIEDCYQRETTPYKIVVASGYFDPLHIGHLEYLELAAKLGERLIVILNNDKQIKLKKGKPFMDFEERKKILESLRAVDEVFDSIDSDKTVCKSLEKIDKIYGIDIFAKGGDRTKKEIPEAKVCNKLGIKIIDGLGKKIQSSSDLIRKENDRKK